MIESNLLITLLSDSVMGTDCNADWPSLTSVSLWFLSVFGSIGVETTVLSLLSTFNSSLFLLSAQANQNGFIEVRDISVVFYTTV